MHDRIAELRGLRDELAICENGPRTSRRSAASLVRAEIERLAKELAAEVAALEARVKKAKESGQNGLAPELEGDIARIRDVLGDDAPKPKAGRAKAGTAAKQDADPAKPPEQT
jgi:hypothetical protein